LDYCKNILRVDKPSGFLKQAGFIFVLHLQNYLRGNSFIFRMKRLFSIIFVFVIPFSGMHLTVATHLCGGEIAASKVSFSGELATCGMESPSGNCPISGKHLGNHCCEDLVSVLAVENNYTPSFSEDKPFSPPVLQIVNIPLSLMLPCLYPVNPINTIVGPPGNFLVSDVSLPDICVFRI
jgi:hypothetical protein